MGKYIHVIKLGQGQFFPQKSKILELFYPMNLLNEWEENLESHEIEIQAQNKYTYSHCLLVLVHGFEKIT